MMINVWLREILYPYDYPFGDALLRVLSQFDNDFKIERAEQGTQTRIDIIDYG